MTATRSVLRDRRSPIRGGGVEIVVAAAVGLALWFSVAGEANGGPPAHARPLAVQKSARQALGPYDWRVEVYAVDDCSYAAACSYFGRVGTASAMPGEVISVYQNHSKVFTVKTDAAGYALVKLPKGTSTVWFQHPPYLGQNWAVRDFPITAPVAHIPGSKYDFILDTSAR